MFLQIYPISQADDFSQSPPIYCGFTARQHTEHKEQNGCHLANYIFKSNLSIENANVENESLPQPMLTKIYDVVWRHWDSSSSI